MALVVALSALAWRQRGRRPWLLWGWLWFLVALFPVIGLVQAGAQARADRYTYLPLVGVFVALVWSLAGLAAPPRWRRPAAAAAERFREAVHLAPRAADGWYNLGTALGALGQHAEAAGCFERAVQLRPAEGRAWLNLALAWALSGRPQAALEACRGAAAAHAELGARCRRAIGGGAPAP